MAKGVGKWFAVRCQPRREDVAKLNLERQHFECFLPKVRSWQLLKGKRAQRFSAFFPGYLFVKLDLETTRWRSIDGTIGVIEIIKFGVRPRSIPEGVIESIFAAADENGIIRFEDNLQPGDKVRVVGGPFDNVLGLVECVSEEDRVRVLLDMMSRQVMVSVPKNELIGVR